MRTLKKLLYVFSFVLLVFSANVANATTASNAEIQQAEKQIKGTVKSEIGEPLIGVSVRSSVTTSGGTVTNLNGEYSLTVSSSTRSLVFSYVGMKSQTVDIDNRATINVTLSEDAVGLNEVVAIGYGTVRKKDITGSVSSVNAKTLSQVPVASPTEALTGKMAGVQVTTTEGSPDAEMKIRVCGGGSITQSNEPLFIVDGFPVSSIVTTHPLKNLLEV